MPTSVFLNLSQGGEQFTGQLIGPAADNTAAPPFTFAGDLDTGLASAAAGTVDLMADGIAALAASATALTPAVPLVIPTLYGSELAPALTAGNWTVGAGWESPIVGPGLIKNADGTGTQTPSAATSIVVGTRYKVSITITGLSVGSVAYTLGGTAAAQTMNANGTWVENVLAGTTGKLILTPTNTSRFTISAISILPISLVETLQDPATATVTAPVQLSPTLTWLANGWDTDDAVSRPVRFGANLLTSGTTTVAGTWQLVYFDPITNARTLPLTLTSAGGLTTLGFILSGGSVFAATGSSFIHNSRTALISSADGLENIQNNAGSSGIGFDVNTDSTLKVRTRAQNAYGTVDCLGLKASGAAGFNGTVTPVTSITVVNGIVTAVS